MYLRIITLAVLLWIVVSGRACSQKDSIDYQLRVGVESGLVWFEDIRLFGITCTGAWYPFRVPIRLELMAGAGSLEHETSVYLLGARISAPLTRVVRVHAGATFVKPKLTETHLHRVGILKTDNFMDALCAEWGLSLEFGSTLYLSFFMRQSVSKTVYDHGERGPFIEPGFGLAYIIEW